MSIWKSCSLLSQWRPCTRLCPYILEPTRLYPHDCAQTLLCPHTFMPTHVYAHTWLCPDTFVPRHVCVQTRLCTHMFVPRHNCALTCYNRLVTIVSGQERVWAQTCLGTILMCLGTNLMCLGINVSGHNHVWVQSCLGTNVSGHKCVSSKMCLGTNVWAQLCMGTNVVEPITIVSCWSPILLRQVNFSLCLAWKWLELC